MKLTKKQAKELSVKKWEYIVNNDGRDYGLLKKYPELDNLQSSCGYCEKYLCDDCPINNGFLSGCVSKNHPYYKWTKNYTKANAQRMLNLILNS